MPIYEYRCESCQHELEKLQRMNDDRLVDCPACGQPALKRLVSAAVFRLKGDGWYETDFKQGKKRNLAESAHAESGSKDTAEVASSGGDAKTADKSPAASDAQKPAAKASAKPGQPDTA